MTVLVGGPKPVAIAEPEIDMSDIASGTATVKTATVYRLTRGPSFDQFAGSFTYDGSGNLVGGTITGWKRVTGGAAEFTATGFSLPVTAFLGFLFADDAAGFLGAVFSGDDRMTGSATFDDLRGGNGNDTISGGGGNDGISGGDGNDSLLGGAGGDALFGDGGNDTMAGGDGADDYFVDDIGDVVNEAAGQGIDLVFASIDYTLAANVENLVLNVGAKGTGNDLSNRILGSFAADTLSGGLGNDSLNGDTGADLLIGGKGNDLYTIDNAGDIVNENPGEGTDTVQSRLAIYTLTDNVENLILLAGAVSGTGNDLANVITGNSASGDLFGLGGNDVLFGGAGEDLLDGGTGADSMAGGAGADTYRVESAGDKVVELAGPDSGFDLIIASVSHRMGANVEMLNLTGAGAINGTGNASGNFIEGMGLSDHKLSGLQGSDSLFGGAGKDTLDGGAGNDNLEGGDDNDRLLGGDGSDSLIGGDGLDIIAGGAGNDSLIGGDGLDIVAGGAGNDSLDGGLGADTMLGGAGIDFYFIDDAGDTIAELTGQGFDRIDTTLANFSLDTAALRNIEVLALEVQGTATGNALNNLLLGNNGNDTLIGGLGNDTLEGTLGTDSLSGGKGHDLYFIDNAGDVVSENAGEGTDTVQSSLLDTSLAAPMFATIERLSLVLNAICGTGNGLANVVAGNEKNNSLDGAAGNDTMIGGTGNDTYTVDSAGDRIVELAGVTSGFDIVDASVSYALSANVERLNLTGAAVNGAGNAQGNVIAGNGQANKLFGGGGDDHLSDIGGNDSLDGGIGSDTLLGGDGNDRLLGGAGNDSLVGDLGIDTLAGGAGNDLYAIENAADQVIEAAGQGLDLVAAIGDFTYSLSLNVENLDLLLNADGAGNALGNRIDGGGGFSGDNAMSGLGGNDTLIGGSGADIMTGGAGRDSFVLIEIDGVLEIINDLAAGKNGDRLDLSDLLTGFGSGNSNPNDFVQFGSVANDTIVRVDVDGAANGANFVDACLLQGVTLTSVDQAIAAGNLLLA